MNLCAGVAASSCQVELKVARWPDSLRRSFWCCHRRCVGLQDLRPVKRLSGVPLTATLVTRTTAPSTTTVPTVAPFRGTARQAPSGTTVRNTTVRGSNIYCHKAWSFQHYSLCLLINLIRRSNESPSFKVSQQCAHPDESDCDFTPAKARKLLDQNPVQSKCKKSIRSSQPLLRKCHI